MRKNSNRTQSIKSTIGWTVSLLLLAVLTYFSVARKSQTIIEGLEVNIHAPKGKKSMVTAKEVKQVFATYLGYDVELAKIDEVNLIELEDVLNQDRRIKRAEVYLDANDRIRVAIRERNIIMRVQEKDISYYLDEEGVRIPSRKHRAVRVPVVTGHLEEYSEALWEGKKRSNLKDVWALAKEIEADRFLTSLIEQIHIEQNGRITMVPKMGREKIYLTAVDMKDKLFNLKVFYKEGLPKKGWSKYSSLDLDTRGQVVAEKLANN